MPDNQEVTIKRDGPPYRKGPPKYMLRIKDPSMLTHHANSMIVKVRAAARHKVPIAVKAYCCNLDTAQYWAGVWFNFGVISEMLLNSTVYFELSVKQLEEIAPRLPKKRTQFMFVSQMPVPKEEDDVI